MKRNQFLTVCLLLTMLFNLIANYHSLKTYFNLRGMQERSRDLHRDFVAELGQAKELNTVQRIQLEQTLAFDTIRVRRELQRELQWQAFFEQVVIPEGGLVNRSKDRIIHWNGRSYTARVIGGKTITINPGDVVLPKEGDRLVEVEVLDIPPREVNPLTNGVP